MSLLKAGSKALVHYGQVPSVWHERLVLAHITAAEYAVCTPDFDIYSEDLSLQNPDFEGFRLIPSHGGAPPGIPLLEIYGFRAVTAADVAALIVEGTAVAEAERLARGLVALQPGGGGAPPAGLVGAAIPAAVLLPLAPPPA